MARIRTIKPEFWTSAQVVECSTTARLLFIGMWNFCDDAGNIPYHPKQIKMQVFPGDNFGGDYIEELLNELIKAKLLICYQSGTEQYLHVTGWHHQKIEKKSTKYPGYSENSTTIRRPFDDRSPPEGKGRERRL